MAIAVIQLGTLLAVLVYFSRDISNISRAFVVDHIALLTGRGIIRRSPNNRVGITSKLSNDAWLGWLVIIGSIPVVFVGLRFKKQIEGTFTKNLWVIATMMIVVAILLGIAELVGKRKRSMADPRSARRFGRGLRSGVGADSRFQQIRIDYHGRTLCR